MLLRCRPGLLLPLFGLSLLLLFLGLSLLPVFFLLCVQRNNGSEKEEQSSRADKSNRFHEYCLHNNHPYRDFRRQPFIMAGASVTPI